MANPRHKRVAVFVQDVCKTVVEFILVLIFTLLICLLVLFAIKMFWYAYFETPVGRRFSRLYPAYTASLFFLADRESIPVAVAMLFSLMQVAVPIAVVGRFFHLSRWFYDTRGPAGRIVWWGIPISLMSSSVFYYQSEIETISVAWCAMLVPALIFYPACSKAAGKLIPETGDVIRWIKPETLDIRK